jgi:hypothetical protein
MEQQRLTEVSHSIIDYTSKTGKDSSSPYKGGSTPYKDKDDQITFGSSILEDSPTKKSNKSPSKK